MPLPKPGEQVKVVLRNGETVEGVVEWIDGNGAWVKNPQKSRWVPVEALLVPGSPQGSPQDGKKDSSEE